MQLSFHHPTEHLVKLLHHIIVLCNTCLQNTEDKPRLLNCAQFEGIYICSSYIHTSAAVDLKVYTIPDMVIGFGSNNCNWFT